MNESSRMGPAQWCVASSSSWGLGIRVLLYGRCGSFVDFAKGFYFNLVDVKKPHHWNVWLAVVEGLVNPSLFPEHCLIVDN